MTINPFEPPRAIDEPAGSPGSGSAEEVTEEALTELARGAPWARWSGRMSLLTAGTTVVEAVFRTIKGRSQPNPIQDLLSVVVTVAMCAVLWVMSRRYAGQAQRLPGDGGPAMVAALETQQKLFKTTAVLFLVSIVVVGLGMFTK